MTRHKLFFFPASNVVLSTNNSTSEQISHGVTQTANRKLLGPTGLQVQKKKASIEEVKVPNLLIKPRNMSSKKTHTHTQNVPLFATQLYHHRSHACGYTAP